MTESLLTLNLALDVVIKILFLFVLFYAIMVLRNFDKFVKSVERSAESLERTADEVNKLLKISRWIPMVGRKKDE